MHSRDAELRALLERARVQRLQTPGGYLVVGVVAGQSDYVYGSDGSAVVDGMIERASSGDRLLVTCEPELDHGPLVAKARAAEVEVVLGTRHPRTPADSPTPEHREHLRYGPESLGAAFWKLNEAQAFAFRTGRPLVVAKMATSIDGRIATRTGESKWITGSEARAAGHILRRRSGAILVGRNTVVADNPTLTARIPSGPGGPNPIRAVISTRPDLPRNASLRDVASAKTTLFHSVANETSERELNSAGIETHLCSGPDGRVDLFAVLQILHQQGVTQVLVEGGGELIGSFADAGLIDRVVHFRAPLLVGGAGARPCVGGLGVDQLSSVRRGWRTEVGMAGDDVELTTDFALELRPPTCERRPAG